MIDIHVRHSWHLDAESVRALAFAVHSNPVAALGPQGNANGRVVHIEGLWADAVASMLYRDYSRKQGEWIPNIYGGRENLEAIGFLRHLNAVVAERCPGAIVIAEESTAWPGVSRPISEGGLGFSYKWNMGWMHDTLCYMEQESIHRQYHHNDMTFGLLYAFTDRKSTRLNSSHRP